MGRGYQEQEPLDEVTVVIVDIHIYTAADGHGVGGQDGQVDTGVVKGKAATVVIAFKIEHCICRITGYGHFAHLILE